MYKSSLKENNESERQNLAHLVVNAVLSKIIDFVYQQIVWNEN
jgi:hypothetical protein